MWLWKSYENGELREHYCQASKLRRGGRTHRCTPNCWNVYWWQWNSVLGKDTGYTECSSLFNLICSQLLVTTRSWIVQKNQVSGDGELNCTWFLWLYLHLSTSFFFSPFLFFFFFYFCRKVVARFRKLDFPLKYHEILWEIP